MPRVVHFEIPVDDPERALAFYKRVFGWEFNKYEGPGEYWLITTGPDAEPGINGGMGRREGQGNGPSPTAYVCTVGVESIDDSMKRVADEGGLVTTPKMTIPGVGWMAYCVDTEGNQFGIMQPDENAA
jgi:predicted enzyme related to lactoylglutathione lyase